MTSSRSLTPKTSKPCRRQFADFSVVRQLWEGIGCAVLAGAITGYCLGTNLWLYLGTATIAAVAGVPAATQHSSLRGALVRTTVGGFLWALAVLVVFVARGHEAVMPLPNPLALYLVTTTLPAMVVGWLVWAWTNRSAAVTAAPAA